LHVQKVAALTLEFSTSDNTYVSSPTFNYTYDDENKSVALTRSPQIVYVDYGSNWKVASEFSGSDGGERWITNQVSEGIVNGSQTMNFSFYHQYEVKFGYSVVGNTPPDTPPVVSYFSLGTTTNLELNASDSSLWVDALSTFTYSHSILGNGSLLERWVVASNQTGKITNSSTVTPLYYHQYLVKAGYAELGGGSGFSAPSASFQSLGSSVNTTLQLQPSAYWVDSNSTWSIQKVLSGSSSLERWISTNSTKSANVDSPLSISLDYQNQYFVSISSTSSAAGRVDPRSGWYNSGEAVTFSAIANSGWKFSGWTGSGAVASNGTAVVGGPLNETAEFEAGLILSASSGGQFVYTAGSAQGTIMGDSSQTVYVTPGTRVILSASPSSALYSFRRWSLGSDVASSSSSYSLLVSTPTSIAASFSPNYELFVLLGIVTFGGVASALLFITKRKHPKMDSSEESKETDDFEF
jgi:hypothetical protein